MNEAVAKIRLRNVRKSFGEKLVLDGIDLDIMSGTSMVVIGGSGTGKSVLLKCILGLLEPDAGTIEIDGTDILALPRNERETIRSRIGMLFQNGALFDSLSVWENVAFRLINADGVKRPAARQRAIEALERVRLGGEVADLYPGELSGGMQKRVGLARAVVATPEIIFFDEPTTGLDPITAAAINDLIVEQVRRLGCTAVSITHDLASARTIGDEIAMLNKGRIIWRGTPAELDRTDDPRVRQFVDGRPDGPLTDRR